ncbi:MAG: hypothetical protein RIQ56_73 [Candidatus Parcubacteria bacterium]|jgi:hypothetical protein
MILAWGWLLFCAFCTVAMIFGALFWKTLSTSVLDRSEADVAMGIYALGVVIIGLLMLLAPL